MVGKIPSVLARLTPDHKFRLLCAVGMLLWLPIIMLEEWLLDVGVLNTKEGTKSGTVVEYFLKDFHWEVAIGLLMLVAAISFLMLFVSICIQSLESDAKVGKA